MKRYSNYSSETGASFISYTLLVTLIALAVLSAGGSSNDLSSGINHSLASASNETLGGSTIGTTAEPLLPLPQGCQFTSQGAISCNSTLAGD